MLPPKDQLTICFAHVAYRLRERFLALATGIESFEVRDGPALEQRIGEADVLVISGLWRNDLLLRAKRAALHPVDRCRHRPVSHARRSIAAFSQPVEGYRPRRSKPASLRPVISGSVNDQRLKDKRVKRGPSAPWKLTQH